MIKFWANITSSLGLCAINESTIHEHAPEESAELFHAADGGSTEWEYLNLLFSIVVARKPRRVIETGTASGFGTLALAAAVYANGVGSVVTVDTGECHRARSLVSQFGLTDVVQFVQRDALSHCATTLDCYDFGFFDSDVGVRHKECQMLIRRKKISGLAAFHDASPLRFVHGSNFEMVKWIEGFSGIILPLSRGMALINV